MTFPIAKRYTLNAENGFIALWSVLLAGSAALSAVIFLLLLGLGASRTSFALEQSNQAKALANACAEEALEKIRESIPFSGSGGLALGQGTCSYTVTDLGGQNRLIISSGTVGSAVRKAQITINKIRPQINIVSWQEVADF